MKIKVNTFNGIHNMNINYTGQTRCVRKMMIDHYHMKPEDVAMMSDNDVIDKINKDFVALEMQNDNDFGTDCETIIEKDVFKQMRKYTLDR